jgi:hypothetical protein
VTGHASRGVTLGVYAHASAATYQRVREAITEAFGPLV